MSFVDFVWRGVCLRVEGEAGVLGARAEARVLGVRAEAWRGLGSGHRKYGF